MTSSSRDPAAIPTRRTVLPWKLAAWSGFSLTFIAGLIFVEYLVVTAWLGGTS